MKNIPISILISTILFNSCAFTSNYSSSDNTNSNTINYKDEYKVYPSNLLVEGSKWQISGLENYPNASCEIYNRWGKLVYSTEKITSNLWDGNDLNGNKLKPGMYYYCLQLDKNRALEIKDWVSVK